ncbi:helix-turn-helix domain-containing protein [Methylibium sp.]|uniref:helix-turn-helix domain-containing protein n=1 Tax=Methylibium sp. TaxID=2067992 RepID=UPI001859ED57|nr:helix-turn-helix domain-containing protein [Methylibium sp.]MBA3588507.1 helix-turn-helix domain-containing protein [Methylibium sp.]
MTTGTLLTTRDVAALLGKSDRTVRYMVARGDFPAGSVFHVGRSRHQRHARFLTAKLVAAGWLLPDAAASQGAAP